MSDTHGVLVHQHGGPEVLVYGPLSVPDPAPGEVRVRQQAIGLNYADIYQRQGQAGPHATGQFPFIPGSQGAGQVEAVGAGVQRLRVGDAVGYIHGATYADAVCVPEDRAVLLPPSLPVALAAAFLLRGLTAEYLLHRLHAVQPGEAILVHAAAGGMGEVLGQWGRALGSTVIGTVGGPAKIEIARAHGCHHVVDYRKPGWVDEVNALTNGEGVAVVYDAVGKDVFVDSLACLRTRGLAINYGTASGNVEGFALQRLHARSLSVCRPTLRSFIAKPDELATAAARFIRAIELGWLRLTVSRRYALRDVQQAHADLAARATTGAAILVPQGVGTP